MEVKIIKIPFGQTINALDPPRNLSEKECVTRHNYVFSPTGVKAHENFQAHAITSATHIKNVCEYTTPKGGKELIMFAEGLDDNGVRVGMLIKEKMGDGTQEVMVDRFGEPINSLDPEIVPEFVSHGHYLYIFFGGAAIYPDAQAQPVYDGRSVTYEIYYPSNIVTGCTNNARLFFGTRGTLFFTDVYSNDFNPNNYIVIGDNAERITAVRPMEDGIFIGKERSVWLLRYRTLEENAIATSDATLRKIADVGVISPHSCVKVFDTIVWVGVDGAYTINPRKLGIGEGDYVEVAPGVAKISKKVFSKIAEIKQSEGMYKTSYTKWGTAEDHNWDEHNDFLVWQNLCVTVDNSSQYCVGIVDPGANIPGYGKFSTHKIMRPSGYKFYRFVAHGVNYGVNSNIDFAIGVSQYGGLVIPKFDHPWFPELIWFWDIRAAYQNEPYLYLHAYLNNYSGEHFPAELYPPFITSIDIYVVPEGNPLTLSECDDTFYMSGDATSLTSENDGERRTMFVDGGWGTLSLPGTELHRMIPPKLYDEGKYVVGCGRDTDTGYGILLMRELPLVYGDSMTVMFMSGELDFDLPTVPKKVRKIFVTYKDSSGGTISITGENDTKTITLPAHTEMAVEEINMRTERSKWFQFCLTCGSDDFELADLKAVIKFYNPNEI